MIWTHISLSAVSKLTLYSRPNTMPQPGHIPHGDNLKQMGSHLSHRSKWVWVFIYLTEAKSAWWAMSCCSSCAISKLTNSKRWAVLFSFKQDNPELAWLNNWPTLPQVIGTGFTLCLLIQDPLINLFQTDYCKKKTNSNPAYSKTIPLNNLYTLSIRNGATNHLDAASKFSYKRYSLLKKW